jgi:hypothetical protein
MLLICVALAAVLTGCSGGGPSSAKRSACTPFERLTLPTSPPASPGESSGSADSLPTKWVTQLFHSDDSRLVAFAQAFERGQADNQTIRAIQSECTRIGA